MMNYSEAFFKAFWGKFAHELSDDAKANHPFIQRSKGRRQGCGQLC